MSEEELPGRVAKRERDQEDILEGEEPGFVAHLKVEEGQMPVVWVEDQNALDSLWRNGFFGKGMLSRSNPFNLKRLLSHHHSSPPSSSSSSWSAHHKDSIDQNDTTKKKGKRTSFHKKDALSAQRGAGTESPFEDLVDRLSDTYNTDPMILGFEETIFLMERRLIRLKRETSRFLPRGFEEVLAPTMIHEENEETHVFLSLDEAWRTLCSFDPVLPVTFTVYRLYRSKGWVCSSFFSFSLTLTEFVDLRSQRVGSFFFCFLCFTHNPPPHPNNPLWFQ